MTKKRRGPSKEFTAKMLAVLANGPASAHHLARDCNTTTQYTNYCLRVLVRAGKIHVSRWEHLRYENGMQTPFFAAGPGKSVPRPEPKSRAKISKDFMVRLKQRDPEKLVRIRELQYLRRKGPRPDPITSALYGGGAWSSV